MSTHADKNQEDKNQSVSNGHFQTPSSGESTFQLADNRPETMVQRELHEVANTSPQAKQAAQLQSMADNSTLQQQPIQKKENNTGLPDNLKSGMEQLSGMSLDAVKVHRNSSKPSQLQAHAYAQGTDIHLGPGQEKHLPHEAWHVVQQKQGRVKPTMQMKGLNINDNTSLENEADVMGAKAMNVKAKPSLEPSTLSQDDSVTQKKSMAHTTGCGCAACTSTGSIQRKSNESINAKASSVFQLKPCPECKKGKGHLSSCSRHKNNRGSKNNAKKTKAKRRGKQKKNAEKYMGKTLTAGQAQAIDSGQVNFKGHASKNKKSKENAGTTKSKRKLKGL